MNRVCPKFICRSLTTVLSEMEKIAMKGTRGEAPEETNPADTSVSECEPPELSGNNCLCLRPPVSATPS